MPNTITPKDYVDYFTRTDDVRIVDAPKHGVTLRFNNTTLTASFMIFGIDPDSFFCSMIERELQKRQDEASVH